MKSKLTVLSFGGGQDSTCILYKFVHDPDFRDKYLEGKLIVVMSDTGNEHPHTYIHIDFIKSFCAEHSIPFFFLTADLGYHPRTWPTLQDQYLRNSSLMTVAFPKNCTVNLKIVPFYNFLDHYIAREYFGYTAKEPPKGKKYLKEFARLYGKVNVILGIAHGEESRIADRSKNPAKELMSELFDIAYDTSLPKWSLLSISKIYPLIEERMERKACQDYIRSIGLPLPFPSNCLMCPYLSKMELLWLYRNLPNEFDRWVFHEKRKLEKNKNNGKRNLGVKGEKYLEQVLAEALVEFGHLSDQELDHYKMSHGHCVMSSY